MNKRIKYGNKSKEKTHNNEVIESLKEGDELFSALISQCNPTYQSYLNKVVQSTKTPSKKKKSITNIDESFVKSPFREKQSEKQFHQQQQININTIPIHKFKNKSHGKGHSAKQQMLNPKISTRLNQNGGINKSSQYTRFPTQQAQLFKKAQKQYQTSLICSQEEDLNEVQNPKFISGIDQYLINLQNSNTFTQKRTYEKEKRKRLFEDDDIRNTEEILHENVKLRKKLKKYEKIIDELHESAENHLKYCRKKQKASKSKTNQLIRSLAKAITKISEQKEQLDTMKTLFKNFGRKAQEYSKQYEQESSDPEEIISESLIKGMRLSRPHSEEKIKNKNGIDYNIRQYIYEKDL